MPTYYAQVSYTGDGNTTQYSITFSFIDSTHVKAFINGTETTAFTISSSTLTFTSAPANGATIRIERQTPIDGRLVDFTDGSVLTESDLDKSADQNFFVAQEITDDSLSTMKIGTDDKFDGQSKVIKDVANPVNDNDAVNKTYLENTWLSSSDKANINTLAGISGLSALASNEANINTVATDISNVNTNATNIANINSVATNITNINSVNTNQTNINTVATNISNINTVASDISKVITVADDLNEAVAEIDTVATNITNVNNVGNNITNVNTVASNISGVNSFAERYRVQAGVPSTDNDVGDLVFDQTAGKLKVFDGSSYQLAGSSVNGTSQRFKYVATASQTTFSGADANGNTLAYDVASGTAFADIYLNGVKLDVTDFTATDGTSIVLASGASVNDILQVVAYGTFELASFSAGNLTSGTINNDRLPSPVLTVKGDGSSADGALRLNCSQNSHYTELKSATHGSYSGNLSFTLPTSTGTNGQVLATNGSGVLSFIDATETKPTVADVSQTIAPATATTINITGTNFVSIPIVEFIKTDGSVTLANTVSFTNSTTLSVNVTLALGNYYVRVENPDGNAGRSTNNILTASTAPSFTTSAGSLGTFAGDFSGTVATIAGTSDSAITFSEVGSNLTTANVTLNSSTGALETTDFGGSSTTATTYNFTIRITDAEGQTVDRNFSFTSSFGLTNGVQFN